MIFQSKGKKFMWKKISQEKKATSKWSEKVYKAKNFVGNLFMKVDKPSRNYQEVMKSRWKSWKVELSKLQVKFSLVTQIKFPSRIRKVGRRSTIWIKLCEIYGGKVIFFESGKAFLEKQGWKGKFDKEKKSCNRWKFFLLLCVCMCVCVGTIFALT